MLLLFLIELVLSTSFSVTVSSSLLAHQLPRYVRSPLAVGTTSGIFVIGLFSVSRTFRQIFLHSAISSGPGMPHIDTFSPLCPPQLCRSGD